MTFKMKSMPLAVLGVITSGALSMAAMRPALAQEAPSQDAEPVQRVVVTGSNISRADKETPSPVQTITADDMKKSGYNTVSDVLAHIAAMWLLLANGILYLLINIFSGRLRRQFFPLTARQLFDDLFSALRGKLAHADLRHYNSVQKLAYLFVMADSVVLVLSGLVLWKSVQFPLLRELIGGYETARRVHFFAMSGLVAFLVVHVVMVALVPRTLLAMLRGR